MPTVKFNQNFSVVKFETAKLFNISTLPQPIVGTITEIANVATQLATAEQSSSEPVFVLSSNGKKSSEPVVKPQRISAEEVSAFNEANIVADNDICLETGVSEPESLETAPVLESPLGDYEQYTSVPEFEPILIGKAPTKKPKSVSGEPESVSFEQIDLDSMTKPEIVKAFFDYIKVLIDSKNIIINGINQRCHIVLKKDIKYFAIITPNTFIEFAGEVGGMQVDPAVKDSGKALATLIQNAIHSEKANIPSHNGQIHKGTLTSSPQARRPKLGFYLFSLENEYVESLCLADALPDFKVNESIVFE